MCKIKTIDVICLEWFDKVNGNSYFSANITVNFKMPGEKTINLPFQYGYGDHYKDMAFKELQKGKLIPEQPQHTSFFRYCEENKIIARFTKHENCKKRELMR